MELSSILSSGENIYKYFLNFSIAMIIFNFVYPIEKIKDLEIQKSEIRYKIEVLNNETDILVEEIHTIEQMKNTLKNIQLSDKIEIEKKLSLFNLKFNESMKKKYEIEHNKRVVEYLEKEILFMENIKKFTFIPSVILALFFSILWFF